MSWMGFPLRKVRLKYLKLTGPFVKLSPLCRQVRCFLRDLSRMVWVGNDVWCLDFQSVIYNLELKYLSLDKRFIPVYPRQTGLNFKCRFLVPETLPWLMGGWILDVEDMFRGGKARVKNDGLCYHVCARMLFEFQFFNHLLCCVHVWPLIATCLEFSEMSLWTWYRQYFVIGLFVLHSIDSTGKPPKPWTNQALF